MQFVDLKAQYLILKQAIDKQLQTVLLHGSYIMGPEVIELEQLLAAQVGAKHCITVSSGTDALLVALMALDIKPGDEVITTALSFAATAEAIVLLGAVPVFVDIDPVSYTISSAAVAKAVTKKTRAIMPVSLFGQCYDVEGIEQLADFHHIPVIEDAAQSFGACTKNRSSCNVGTIGCTSFFPSKPLGCYGDGGACFTNDAQLAERMRSIRNHGQKDRYDHVYLGLNARLDTLQAAVLLAKLTIFPQECQQRRLIGTRYTELFKAGGARETHEAESGFLVPHVYPYNDSVYAQYTIQCDYRDKLCSFLKEQGIPTAVHYPCVLIDQPVFVQIGRANDDLVWSRYVANRVLSLPMHPYLKEDDQKRIVDAVVLGLKSIT
jgi:UDP-2-acetamido-2-deoxy-ribo-hexuluronate aminotransferase